jgi:hypothetical protein
MGSAPLLRNMVFQQWLLFQLLQRAAAISLCQVNLLGEKKLTETGRYGPAHKMFFAHNRAWRTAKAETRLK